MMKHIVLIATAGLFAFDSAHAQGRPLDAAVAAFQAGDYAASRPLFEQAANGGSAMASHYLGYLYETGRGVRADTVKAFGYLLKAAQGGIVLSMRSVGTYYWNGRGTAKNVPEAARWYRIAADSGDDESTEDLARILADGKGIKPDTAEAVKLFARASAFGMPYAMIRLAELYVDGLGVPRDTARALSLWAKAAEHGDQIGAHNFASNSIETDIWAAKAYFELAKQLGDTSAPRLLEYVGKYLEQGGLAEYQQSIAAFQKNKAEAFRLSLLARRKGSMLAGSGVVEAYQHGYGVKEDVGLARQNARICAAMGNDNCATILAQYLLAGSGGMKDPEGARAAFEQAALKDNALAMFMLAEMYDKGDEIPRNDALASFWYRRAYAKGSTRAAGLLKSRGLLEVDPKVKAFLDYMDKSGPDRSDVQRFSYEVMVYCKFGGTKCHELTVEAYQLEKRANSQAASANMARIWNLYAPKSGASDADWKTRSDCMRKKTESIEKHTYGKQDWEFAGSC